jgi:hypothetical protein
MDQQQVTPNEPSAWTKDWTTGVSGVHPTYPTDGRETIYDPYEEYAPTDTVRNYVRAMVRVANADQDLPPRFNDYLSQRVPSTLYFGTDRAPLDLEIDRCGRLRKYQEPELAEKEAAA